MHWHDQEAIKLSLWPLQSDFHVLCTSHEIVFDYFFNYYNNVKSFLSSQAAQKEVVHWKSSVDCSLLTPVREYSAQCLAHSKSSVAVVNVFVIKFSKRASGSGFLGHKTQNLAWSGTSLFFLLLKPLDLT